MTICIADAEKNSTARSASAISASSSIASSDEQHTEKNLAANTSDLVSSSEPQTASVPAQADSAVNSSKDNEVPSAHHAIRPTLPPPPQELPPWMQQPHPLTALGFTPNGPRGSMHQGMLPNPVPPYPGQMVPPPVEGQGPWPRVPQPPFRHPGVRPRGPHSSQTMMRPNRFSIPNAAEQNAQNERRVEGLIVRDYKVRTKNVPKFVPRQVVKKPDALKRTRMHGADESEMCAKKLKNNGTEDAVNLELKRTAFVLGDVTGPSLPKKEEKRRQTFLQSEMGDVSLEESMLKIREKVKEFSARALPPQVLKKLKKR